MVGVYVASGIGGFDVIEREHSKLLARRSRTHLAFFLFPRPSSIWLPGTFHKIRSKRGEFGNCDGMLGLRASVGDSLRLIQHGYAER